MLPSRDRNGELLDETTRKEILNRTRAWFRKNLTGKGEKDQTRVLEHPWLEDEYDLGEEFLQESIIEIYASCTEEEHQRAYDSLIKLAEWIREKANQDYVAIYDNGTLRLVE